MNLHENFTTDVAVHKEELINLGSHLPSDPDRLQEIVEEFLNIAG